MKQQKSDRMKNYWLAKVLLFSGTCTFSLSHAGPLDLANEPLFLGYSTDPNVFFELDDSGSMDWEVLTVPYYNFCQYDRNAPHKGGSRNCDTALRDDGLWRNYTKDGHYRDFTYIYDTDDNAYNTGCTSGYWSNLEDCSFTPVTHDWRGVSSSFNVVYYNPKSTYKPWAGTSLQDVAFKSARSNPQPEISAVTAQAESLLQVARPAQGKRDESEGYSKTRDLTGFVYTIWIDSHGFDGNYPKRGSNINRTDTKNGLIDLWDNYYTYTVNATDVSWVKYGWEIEGDGALKKTTLGSGSFSGGATDPNVIPARTAAEIQQNVANWYSYARRRAFVTKAAVGAVVSGSPSFRFGQTLINDSNTLFNTVPPFNVTKYSGYNQALLNDLYSHKWKPNGTPLRKGLEMAGKYYDGDYGAYFDDPIVQSCQQNFTVLFTDGYWNGDSPSNSIGDADKDSLKITVADVAQYYYDRDLSDLANDVVPNAADPLTTQHMVTFPVAFGVKGTLLDTDKPADGWPNPSLASSDKWGDSPFDSDVGKIDDLWHAAFNSKGEFVSAQTPDDVVNSLIAALGEISSRDAASASVATSTGQISSTTAIFQAKFNSGDWSGRLYSFPLKTDDSVDTGNPNWEAAEVLNTLDFDSGRTIISNNGTQGIKFRFPLNYASPTAEEMTKAQVSDLLQSPPYDLSSSAVDEISKNQAFGNAVVDYLRGDRTNEGVSAGSFRPRTSVLGDIVDSDPKYVSAPGFFYPDSLESAKYSTFRTTYKNRKAMVYVGSNDGMLHGFDAATGKELLAYVPALVYGNLQSLTDLNYYHKYFVNEAPTIVDVFYSNGWHTVLAGALGNGGQGIFALDVTNPGSFNEGNAASLFLWEFSDKNDIDMGYSYSEPSIAKMPDGSWVAVFGNGYNNTVADGQVSTTGNAVLYIVDIASGTVLKKIDTGVGDVNNPNGLASPALVDINNDYIVDYIYAGDLYGNMWKFDVTDSNESNWDVSWGSGGVKKPLFTTATGQPITTRPSVGYHPERNGQMVYFGTGKYLERTDNGAIGEPNQSFYGIWDKNETAATGLPVLSADLLSQEILEESVETFGSNKYEIRITSDYPIDWDSHEGWKIDLLNRYKTPIDNNGERQVSESVLRNGRVIFTTVLPSDTPCSPGGTSWLMEMAASNGGSLSEAAFDLNDDNIFDDLDMKNKKPPTAIREPPDDPGRPGPGLLKTPGILRKSDKEIKYFSGASGAIMKIGESAGAQNIGRQSWRELD